MTGILIKNGDRPDIIFENGTLYGGLHCGTCFRLYEGKWNSVRLEHNGDWILICNGRVMPIIYGQTVEII